MDFFIQNQARSMPAAIERCERGSKCKDLFNQNTTNSFQNRGGTTRPLLRDGGMEELYRVPTVWSRPNIWTRGQNRSSAKNGATERLRFCGTIYKEVS